jgi:DnaJ-domain-containing protein 1
MRFIWGTVAGAAIGLAGGPFGSLFGAGIGMLVDQVVEGLRRRRALHTFLTNPQCRPPRNVEAPVAAALGTLAVVVGRRAKLETAAIDQALEWLRDHCRRGTVWGLRNLLRDALAMPETPDAQALAALVAAERDPEECSRWFSLLVDVSAAGRPVWWSIDGEDRELLDGVGTALGIDEGTRNGLLRPVTLLDAEACDILGVARDATAAEVKRVYRTLAAQFHPDTLGDLDDHHRSLSSEAFIRITGAYEQLIEELGRARRL